MLTNSLKISDQTNAELFPTQYIPNAWKNGIIVVPFWFEQCLEAINTLITAWSSEARPFRRLSKNLFRSPSFSEIIRLGYSSFFPKCSKFHAHFRNARKNPEKVFYFWDNGVWTCCAKLCTLQREYLLSAVNVLTNSLKISYQTNAEFFPTQYIPNGWKNGIIVVPCWFEQCLEAVNTLITAWSSEARPFRRLSNHLFRSPSNLK